MQRISVRRLWLRRTTDLSVTANIHLMGWIVRIPCETEMRLVYESDKSWYNITCFFSLISADIYTNLSLLRESVKYCCQ